MKYLYMSMIALMTSFGLSSCVGDLNTTPLDDKLVVADQIFDGPDAYKNALAKIYAVLVSTGQKGPTGDSDISGIDEGASQYLRILFTCQEYPTDELTNAWNDQTIQDFKRQSWAPSDTYISAMYNRIYNMVTMANEYLRETTDAKLDGRGHQATMPEVKVYRAEARFLRALSYWHAIDLFGNVPFVTENDVVGSHFPKQISREDLFTYLEKELLEIEPLLMEPGANVYGRIDRASAWMLLAKLYQNAEVYVNTNRYADSQKYVDKIINSGVFSIHDSYDELFLADNHRLAKGSEIIFAIPYDGLHQRTFGGTGFIINAAAPSGSLETFGMNGWQGNRTSQEFWDKFETEDSRALFIDGNKGNEINNISDYEEGVIVAKFKNITSTGERGKHADFADVDFPLFRLADAYLMYAENVLRGAAGTKAQAVDYVNELRQRAYGDVSGDITEARLTLDFLIEERARELYWEGHRRTDLIRFGKFSNTSYRWPWKGGAKQGTAVDGKYDIYPIPTSDLGANTNLVQNPGY